MVLGQQSPRARRHIGLMASVTQNFMKLFRGSSGGTEATTAQGAQKLTRRSSSLGELSRVWEADTPLCVLDLGSTSAANIRFFTERSHKIYSEDLLVASTDPNLSTKDEQGNPALDSRRFRRRAVLEFVRLSGRESGTAGHGTLVVGAEARRHDAGVFPHQGRRAGL